MIFENHYKKIFVLVLAVAISVSFLAVLKFSELSIPPKRQGYQEGGIFVANPIKPLYDNSPYLLPLVWGIFGAVIWRGRIRRTWQSMGYDYDIFKTMTKMRGSPMRISILNALGLPKNKLQLSEELKVDWKTIDNHMKVLKKNNLVIEMAEVGTSTYFIISENGKMILDLISKNGQGQPS